MEWIDNADSWICPICKTEVSSPSKYNYHCPRCSFIADKDKEKELAPCPFCGSNRIVVQTVNRGVYRDDCYAYVQCLNCSTKSHEFYYSNDPRWSKNLYYYAVQKAMKFWNTRVTAPVNIGDTVWFNTYTPDGACIGIKPHKVTKIKTSVMVEGRYIDTELPMKLFNKTWFLTRKEAERSENIGKD